MSKVDYKALREAAEAAKGKTTWQKIQAFKAVATPEVVLELLDALDALPKAEPPAPVVPDEIEPDDSNTFDYVDGWNACRAAMLRKGGDREKP